MKSSIFSLDGNQYILEVWLSVQLRNSSNRTEAPGLSSEWEMTKLIVFDQPPELLWPAHSKGTSDCSLVSRHVLNPSHCAAHPGLISHPFHCEGAHSCVWVCTVQLGLKFSCLCVIVYVRSWMCKSVCVCFCVFDFSLHLRKNVCLRLGLSSRHGGQQYRQLRLSVWFLLPRRFLLLKNIFHTPAPLSTLSGTTFC